MGSQEVSPHIFETRDALDYPGVTAVSAKLIFPHPFTLGDYKRWYRALMPDTTAPDEDEDIFMREYKAALTVGALEETMPEDDIQPGNDGFILRDAIIVDGRVPDTLPIPFAAWVCECADQSFGSHVVIEDRRSRIARLSRWRMTSTTIPTTEPMIAAMLPDLKAYEGKVVFKDTMTKTVYARWQRALQPLPGVVNGDVDNIFFMRQYRAALELLKDWQVDGVDMKIMRYLDGEQAPLVVASFLVLAAEAYLAKTMTLKKMPALYGVT